MKKQHSLNLIDGNFSPSEGREILQNVFKSKVQFHQMRNFSSQELTGKDDQIALRRIPELRATMLKIQEIIEFAQKAGMHLRISSEIEISLCRSKKAV